MSGFPSKEKHFYEGIVLHINHRYYNTKRGKMQISALPVLFTGLRLSFHPIVNKVKVRLAIVYTVAVRTVPNKFFLQALLKRDRLRHQAVLF